MKLKLFKLSKTLMHAIMQEIPIQTHPLQTTIALKSNELG